MNSKGKRYTQEEKTEVVDFVHNYNSEHNGRGGVANASKHFGITAMTVKAWVEKDGRIVAKKGNSSKAAVFQQLADLQALIEEKEAELAAVKEKFEALKSEVSL